MKASIASFFVALAVCAGCTSREVRPVVGPDYTHRSERQQLKSQPIPVPSVTPYDGNQQLQTIFVSGFKKGWGVAMEYWLGNAIAIPEAYQQSAELRKAWQDGCSAGQQALYDRVRIFSAEKVKP